MGCLYDSFNQDVGQKAADEALLDEIDAIADNRWRFLAEAARAELARRWWVEPYRRSNRLNLIRCGSTAVSPRRRFLSSS
jgi:hypothetical protein